MIEHWEKLAREVWPPLECEEVAGFSCAFAHGYSKRANSALASHAKAHAAPWLDRIRAVERHYGSKGLPAIFKLSAATPQALEDALVARDYALVDPTSVCFRAAGPLPKKPELSPPAAVQIGEEPEAFGAAWLAAVQQLGGVSDPQLESFRAIARSMPRPRAFSALRDEGSGKILAIGIGIVAAQALHVCEVATRPQLRGRGFARELVRSLIGWGEERGARWSWLQRVVANRGAAGLYRGLGFREHYRHWYRVSASVPS